MTAADEPMKPAEETTTAEANAAEAARRRLAAERRRIAEVFGDVLPESTRDDLDQDRAAAAGGADPDGQAARDAALLRDVPPHHA